LAQAIKTARELVLLPYTQRTVTERPGGRGRDRDRGERTLGETQGERGDRADRGARAARVEDVSVEVIDSTDALGDAATEDAVAEEVGVLVEELVEHAVASEATNGAGAAGAAAPAGSADADGDEDGDGGGAA